jgi:hypothetical protein
VCSWTCIDINFLPCFTVGNSIQKSVQAFQIQPIYAQFNLGLKWTEMSDTLFILILLLLGNSNTRWFKYDTQIVPVIFEPPCISLLKTKLLIFKQAFALHIWFINQFYTWPLLGKPLIQQAFQIFILCTMQLFLCLWFPSYFVPIFQNGSHDVNLDCLLI